MNTYKNQLRKSLRKSRRQTSQAYRSQASLMILHTLIPYLETLNPQSIHCYLSTTYEVQTDMLIRHLLTLNTKIITWYPSSEGYLYAPITETTTWSQTYNQLPLPSSEPIQLKSPLDVIIVPILGFDEQCNRLGHGQGTYDTFLPQHPHALTMGLAFDKQQIEPITCEPHDIALDYIITETRVITRY